jgi:hypothetical protein
VKGWWRRNLGWLLMLPVAAALLAAAASYRVVNVYLEQPLRERVAEAAPGEPVEVIQEYEDLANDVQHREFTVELTELEELDEIPRDFGDPEPLPEGAAAYAVHLGFEAPLDSDLAGCDIVLVDVEGNRYGDGVDPFALPDPCERGAGDVAGAKDLPEEWKIAPTVLAADDAEINEVWVTFLFPRREYVALRVR